MVEMAIELLKRKVELETNLATNFFQILFSMFALKINQVLAGLAVVGQILVDGLNSIAYLMEACVALIAVHDLVPVLVLCAKAHLAVSFKSLQHFLLLRLFSN